MKLKLSQSKRWSEGYVSVLNNDNESILCQPMRLDWWRDYINKFIGDIRYDMEKSIDEKGEVCYFISEK